jgi:broad specificity phosphatase PhoE
MAERMNGGKEVVLVVVRHGQGTHNLKEEDAGRAVSWTEEGDLDTQLTALGREQAGLVGARLAGSRPDLAISSHLCRARDTALAVLEHHAGVQLEEWRVVKERCYGSLLEGRLDLVRAQWKVEAAVEDRSLLSWRPPGLGAESMVDLTLRVEAFLAEVQARALALASDRPLVLVVSHGVFMNELYRVLVKPERFDKPKLRNTGIDRYRLSVGRDGKLEGAVCELASCATHLDL